MDTKWYSKLPFYPCVEQGFKVEMEYQMESKRITRTLLSIFTHEYASQKSEAFCWRNRQRLR